MTDSIILFSFFLSSAATTFANCENHFKDDAENDEKDDEEDNEDDDPGLRPDVVHPMSRIQPVQPR